VGLDPARRARLAALHPSLIKTAISRGLQFFGGGHPALNNPCKINSYSVWAPRAAALLPLQKASGCLNTFNFLEKNAVEETGGRIGVTRQQNWRPD
jgi:hypothetical protein